MISIYQVKPQFQALLRPLTRKLAQAGVSANSVTLCAMLVSLGLGLWLFLAPSPANFLCLPLWMFLRMALNAIDGMLAREFGQKTALGAYLNELCDVVSDTALYLPFVLIPPFGWGSMGLVIVMSILSEMTGVMAATIGAARRYDGPMGKSDRAFVFGSLGLWLGAMHTLPQWLFWVAPLMVGLMSVNIVLRIRRALAEAKQNI